MFVRLVGYRYVIISVIRQRRVFFHIEIVPSNAKRGNDNDAVPGSDTQKFGMRENIVAFPVGSRSLVPMK